MISRTAGGAPEYVCKDGQLMIFSRGDVLVVRGWPVPTARRKVGGLWEAFTPEFRIVNPYRPARKKSPTKSQATASAPQMLFDFGDSPTPGPAPRVALSRRSLESQRRKRALDGFRFSLPREVARVLEPFQSHQWPLLVLLANDPTALDLAKANPALAYAVALHFNGDTDRIVRAKAGTLKQRDLLAMLGLAGSKSLVNLFAKITPESLDGRNLPVLMAVLSKATEEVQLLLAHAPKVNRGVMQLVLDPRIRHAVTPTLVAEVASDSREKYRAAVARQLAETLAMETELGNPAAARKFPSVERLQKVHGQVSTDFGKLQSLRDSLGPLPLPPLPAIEGIEPLVTKQELVNEGTEQHNCVASYAAEVVAGRCYIYRVRQPERATLSVERGPDGQWHIGQLKAACNGAVRVETQVAVTRWLDMYRFGFCAA